MSKILYVEDHPAQRELLAQMLKLQGFEVAVADNGSEAVEKASNWLPDLILMDLRMPLMDGYQAIQIIRSVEKTTKIPIIAISAWGGVKDKDRAKAAGANEHITKPVDFNRLLTTMGRYIELPQQVKSSTHSTLTVHQELRLTEPIINTQNIPYIVGSPVTNPQMFFGREQILQKIMRALHNNNMMLTGPRRIGKTSLLHQLKNRLVALDDPNYFFAPIFIDVQGVRQEDFFYTVMDEIVMALSDYLPAQTMPTLDFNRADLTYPDRTFGKDLGKIIKTLQETRVQKTVKLVLLMDEMDVMNSYDQRVQSQLRSIFQKDIGRNLAVVVAGVDLRQAWERYESPFYNMFTPLVLEPFTPEQARELITKPVMGLYTYDEAAIQRILKATGRHPFRLQQLCLEIIQHVVEANRQQITLADVEATLAIIHWIEEENHLAPQEASTQPHTTPRQVLAEKQAPYDSSTPPQQNEEVE